MRKTFLLILLFAFPLVCLAQDATTSASPKYEKDQPLALTIKSDKEVYEVGEAIIIIYFLKNMSQEPVGFYVGWDDVIIEAFDKTNKRYDYYYDKAAQRMMPPLYPDEYVFLGPQEQWAKSKTFKLVEGNIQSYEGSKRKPEFFSVYDGMYIDCQGGCGGNDFILLSGFSGGDIKISAKYKTNNPNPRNFTIDDCKGANIFVDSNLREDDPDKISHGWICEGGACPDLDDPLLKIKPGASKEEIEEILKSSGYDSLQTERIHELAIYCQQNKTLTKPAWTGILTSNTITIEVVEKK